MKKSIINKKVDPPSLGMQWIVAIRFGLVSIGENKASTRGTSCHKKLVSGNNFPQTLRTKIIMRERVSTNFLHQYLAWKPLKISQLSKEYFVFATDLNLCKKDQWVCVIKDKVSWVACWILPSPQHHKKNIYYTFVSINTLMHVVKKINSLLQIDTILLKSWVEENQ